MTLFRRIIPAWEMTLAWVVLEQHLDYLEGPVPWILDSPVNWQHPVHVPVHCPSWKSLHQSLDHFKRVCSLCCRLFRIHLVSALETRDTREMLKIFQFGCGAVHNEGCGPQLLHEVKKKSGARLLGSAITWT